jgi:hypothetical protein
MGLRVKDRGESEGRSVIGRIGVAILLHPKGGRLPRGVGGREPSANRRRLGCRNVGGAVTALAGAPAATESPFGSRPCRSNAQGDPKANGATASRKGCRRTAEPGRVVSRRDVVRCLSCLHRKVPEQFLGEGVLATAPPYPTGAVTFECNF